jgi:hypothetical protein
MHTNQRLGEYFGFYPFKAFFYIPNMEKDVEIHCIDRFHVSQLRLPTILAFVLPQLPCGLL